MTSQVNHDRQTQQSSVPLLWTISGRVVIVCFVLLFSGRTSGTYDVCFDSDRQTYSACQPGLSDIVWNDAFKITVEPSTATCGTPPAVFKHLGTTALQTCDASNPTLSHPPTYMIDSPSPATSTWWQSINQGVGQELKINITLSFNKMFLFSGDMIMTFRYGRPDKMVLEKSVDYGVTWTPLQFYARNCADFQGQLQSGAAITKDTPAAVICTNRYVETSSRPSQNGKVTLSNDDRFSLFLGPQNNDFEAFYVALETKMLDFLLFTDLRLRLLKAVTDESGQVPYSISDIQVASRCYCNLHASYCNYTSTETVCDCEHNTMGKDCEMCKPLYNERPWRRGGYLPYDSSDEDVGTANECIKCECNDHADSCTYNATYGRGICDACYDNTRGNHCELCVLTYYPNVSLPLYDLQRCVECDCELLGVKENNMVCSQTEEGGYSIGQCMCRPLTTGRRCDRCVPGYWGLLLGPTPGNCTECLCNLDGTQAQSNVCEQDTGQCPCKVSTQGRACDECADGYYAFPTGNPQSECFSCGCSKGASLGSLCDKDLGHCTCRTNITGDKCDTAAEGYFVPAIDLLTYEPQPGACEVTSDLYTPDAPFDGEGFAVCSLSTTVTVVQFAPVKGGMIQKALEWPYIVAVRYTGGAANVSGILNIQVTGDTTEDLSALGLRLGTVITPGCPLPQGPSGQANFTFPAGVSTATLSQPLNIKLDARCQYSMTLNIQQIEIQQPPVDVDNSTVDNSTDSNTTTSGSARKKRAVDASGSTIHIDSLVILPALSNADGSQGFQEYLLSDNQTVTTASYATCLQQVAALSTRQTALQSSPCKDILFSVAAELNDGSSSCDCDPVGSVTPSSSCLSLSGQCPCKTGVSGRTCNVCTPGYFNFTENGCIACSCHPSGAEHGSCDYSTGQCLCRSNIILATDNLSAFVTTNNGNTTLSPTILDGSGRVIVVDGTCSFCRPNFYGINSGQGCSPCDCNEQGSTSLQCDESGQCPCKDSVTGLKCDTCRPGFYGFGPEGCSACNCSMEGSLSLICDETSGACSCKDNVEGAKCANCKTGFFNLAAYNPHGCQPCFCYEHGGSCTSAPGFESKHIQIMSPSTADQYEAIVGDRHTSYGRGITLWMSASFRLDLQNETLISLTGNEKILSHKGRNGTVITPGETLQYDVRILEDDWVVDTVDQTMMPSALDVMGILANLSEISHITRSKGQPVTVTYLSVEVAQLMLTPGTGKDSENVSFVEECVCQPADNVAGLSCERCATGYRRDSPINVTSYDNCVPCDCNGRGATDPPECDELTGICLNCRNGTTGDHCESCAAFVTGPECDTCVTEYWGLMADGCRACNCSSPGSTNPVCDPVSGQCVCADHVVGRTCDECEENYYKLTSTGCIECDACFSLMKTEILPLRALRDQITSNVTLLESQDKNSQLGAFVVRIRLAVDETEKLISFLQSAEQSETEVRAKIVEFNSTLDSVQGRMLMIEQNTTVEIEQYLQEIENLVTTARNHRTNMERDVKAVYEKLVTLDASKTTLTSLANSLKSVENYLQSLADASIADQEILDQLDTLNDTVSRANQLANIALQRVQDTLKVHQNTTIVLLALETRLVNLIAKATTTLTSARNLATNNNGTKTTVTRLQQKLVELSSFVVDYATFTSQTRSALTMANSLQSQVSGESGLFSPTNIRALQSVSEVEVLANQTQTSGLQAAGWLKRSRAADQTAQMIQQEVNALFQSAQKTLTAVTTFGVRAEEVKQRANASLEQVTSVAELSLRLIQLSHNLIETLVSLKQNASTAKESSQQALQNIQEKQQRLLALSNNAEALNTKLSGAEDVSEQRYNTLNNTQTNIINPAQERCDSLNSSVTDFKSRYAEANMAVSNALQQASNTTQRANELLALLRNAGNLDAGTIQALLEEVRTTQSNVDFETLRVTVSGLKTSTNVQRAEIDRMKSARDQLKGRIEALKTLQQQTPNTS